MRSMALTPRSRSAAAGVIASSGPPPASLDPAKDDAPDADSLCSTTISWMSSAFAELSLWSTTSSCTSSTTPRDSQSTEGDDRPMAIVA